MKPIFSPVLRDVMEKAIPGSRFIFTCKTTGSAETFTLPLVAAGTYDFQVDWGDNKIDTITAHDDAEVTHTYANAGTYTVKISGTIIGWAFDDLGDKDKIYDIKSWGPLRLGNDGDYFWGCSNLTVTATDILDLTGTTTFLRIFRDCASVITIPNLQIWDVSSVTVFAAAIQDATLFNQDISLWDISSVTAMNYMFMDADAFNQDISGWDTSSVTTMSYMFRNAIAFDQDLSSWDITSVTEMANMFTGVTLSTANYSAILIGWEAQNEQANVTFHGGNSKYSAGAAATARTALVANGWTITDGGQE